MARHLSHHDYTVGWVCTLPVELTAAQEMLDEEHQDLPLNHNDSNIYTLGSIGDHNVVLACLPVGQTGSISAAAVAVQMKNTFPAIRFGLMVGVGGGVPSEKADIRLGDVVVSQPGNGHGGVVQYDFGKSIPGGFERTGFLNAPPPILLAAVTKLQSYLDRRKSDLPPHLLKLSNLPKFGRNEAGNDELFEAEYNHRGGDSCRLCTGARMKQREERKSTAPIIHYGTIASGNQVMRNGVERDNISLEFGGVLCFEMEAAGLMNTFPCLVIRGICNYADSHKNKRWQPYSAGTAAAYAKELLRVIPAVDIAKIKTVDEALQGQSRYFSLKFKEAKGTFYLPFQRNQKFVDRSAELNTGLGGIGKTQVALQFVYSVKADYPEFSIFWVQSSSMETFELSCTEIERALGIRQVQESNEDIKILLRRHLSAKSAGKWLLIADNADDLDLLRGTDQTEGLLAFLPESDDGLTIFTTRHGAVAQYLTGSDVVEIGIMARHETTDLLEKSSLELKYLPLAITQAAAYININKSSISEYLRLLKKTDQDAVTLLSTDFSDKTRYRNLPNTVAKTWTITFDKILECDTLAADLLAYMYCIEWRAIPYSILPPAHSEARLVGAIGMLCSYSFLEKRDGDSKLDMHRLVHLATRIWVNQNGREEETRMAALKHLSEVFPSDDYHNRFFWRDYLPHVARIKKDKKCQSTKENSELCLRVGQCLYVDGRIKEAVLWLQESCEWRDSNLAQQDPDRLASQHALATAYQGNGQVKEAVKLLEHVVMIESNMLGEDHPDRLVSQYALATAYQANGQVKEAVRLLEHVAVMIESNVLGEDHPHRLVSQHVLATAYHANGQVKEAVKLLEQAVAFRSKVLADDFDCLTSQLALVTAYKANGQVKEAEELLEHIAAIRSKKKTMLIN
ncbi:hypothetical protein F1880_007322 [Penicillium rolfsii]|nr:hypothetical protein F1880_007322 [Penicillium rolfsii]